MVVVAPCSGANLPPGSQVGVKGKMDGAYCWVILEQNVLEATEGALRIRRLNFQQDSNSERAVGSKYVHIPVKI